MLVDPSTTVRLQPDEHSGSRHPPRGGRQRTRVRGVLVKNRTSPRGRMFDRAQRPLRHRGAPRLSAVSRVAGTGIAILLHSANLSQHLAWPPVLRPEGLGQLDEHFLSPSRRVGRFDRLRQTPPVGRGSSRRRLATSIGIQAIALSRPSRILGLSWSIPFPNHKPYPPTGDGCDITCAVRSQSESGPVESSVSEGFALPEALINLGVASDFLLER